MARGEEGEDDGQSQEQGWTTWSWVGHVRVLGLYSEENRKVSGGF